MSASTGIALACACQPQARPSLEQIHKRTVSRQAHTTTSPQAIIGSCKDADRIPTGYGNVRRLPVGASSAVASLRAFHKYKYLVPHSRTNSHPRTHISHRLHHISVRTLHSSIDATGTKSNVTIVAQLTHAHVHQTTYNCTYVGAPSLLRPRRIIQRYYVITRCAPRTPDCCRALRQAVPAAASSWSVTRSSSLSEAASTMAAVWLNPHATAVTRAPRGNSTWPASHRSRSRPLQS